jgi:hypothetical protein
MSEWKPEEIEAHLGYYRDLNRELRASGELLEGQLLGPPEQGKVVTSAGTGAPVVTDGPFLETKEWVAGYQIFEVASEERALEIAARLSAVPGPGGVPLRQPIQVRRVIDDGPSDASEMKEYAEGTFAR